MNRKLLLKSIGVTLGLTAFLVVLSGGLHYAFQYAESLGIVVGSIIGFITLGFFVYCTLAEDAKFKNIK